MPAKRNEYGVMKIHLLANTQSDGGLAAAQAQKLRNMFSAYWLDAVVAPRPPVPNEARRTAQAKDYIRRLGALNGLLVVNLCPEIYDKGRWTNPLSEMSISILEACEEAGKPAGVLWEPTVEFSGDLAPFDVIDRVDRVAGLKTRHNVLFMNGELKNVPGIIVANVRN